MEITGLNFVGKERTAIGAKRFHVVNPANGEILPGEFVEATAEEVERALGLAAEAATNPMFRDSRSRVDLLRRIGRGLEEMGGALIDRAGAETGLPPARLQGELARTVGQLRLFANLVEEGSWVDARIDCADANRRPLPKSDLRRMLVPIGPVAVFGASNFPLAFSVAGGDTASALAGGNPVVVKAHPAHPGTSELAACAIRDAALQTGFPEGTFSLLQGKENRVGLALVSHPTVRAVGFTGSLKGGRALFDAAGRQTQPDSGICRDGKRQSGTSSPGGHPVARGVDRGGVGAVVHPRSRAVLHQSWHCNWCAREWLGSFPGNAGAARRRVATWHDAALRDSGCLRTGSGDPAVLGRCPGPFSKPGECQIRHYRGNSRRPHRERDGIPRKALVG